MFKEFPGGLVVKGSGVITAVAQVTVVARVWSLAHTHAMGVAKNEDRVLSMKELQDNYRRHILGAPVLAQWKQIWLVSKRMQHQSLASLSGLRIWCCCQLWCRLQTWLWSHIAVAVAIALIRPLAIYATVVALKGKKKRHTQRTIMQSSIWRCSMSGPNGCLRGCREGMEQAGKMDSWHPSSVLSIFCVLAPSILSLLTLHYNLVLIMFKCPLLNFLPWCNLQALSFLS